MTTYPNSGMQLEHEIESSNLSYQLKGIALIQKVATPMRKIKGKAVYSEKSTVDLNGREV